MRCALRCLALRNAPVPTSIMPRMGTPMVIQSGVSKIMVVKTLARQIIIAKINRKRTTIGIDLFVIINSAPNLRVILINVLALVKISRLMNGYFLYTVVVVFSVGNTHGRCPAFPKS